MKQQMPCDSSNLSIFMTFFTLPKPSWACALQVFKYSTLLFFFLRIFHIQAKGKTSTEQIHSMQLKCFFFCSLVLVRTMIQDYEAADFCYLHTFSNTYVEWYDDYRHESHECIRVLKPQERKKNVFFSYPYFCRIIIWFCPGWVTNWETLWKKKCFMCADTSTYFIFCCCYCFNPSISIIDGKCETVQINTINVLHFFFQPQIRFLWDVPQKKDDEIQKPGDGIQREKKLAKNRWQKKCNLNRKLRDRQKKKTVHMKNEAKIQ